MSLITRCPACGTMFKVVPDQLRISDGWVRCGHCSEIFDAQAHLQDADALASAAQRDAPAPAPPPAAPLGDDVGHDVDPGGRDGAETQEGHRDYENHQDHEDHVGREVPGRRHEPVMDSSLDTTFDDEALDSAGPDTGQLQAQADDLRPSPLDAPFFLAPSAVDDGAAPAPADDRPAVSTSDDEAEPAIWAQSEQEPDLQDLEFVRKAQRRAMWQRRSTRVALAVAVVLGAAVLAAQFAVQERDRLAASQPALRPVISALCAPFGCRIGPPRQIDAIVIDASQFTRLRGDSYRLGLSLRNQAEIAVATPAIELTLTDSEDQPVVRRVIRPEDLAPGMPVLAPKGDWSGSVGVTVATPGLPARVAGYRVLAFYP